MIELRDYQISCIDQLNQKWSEGSRNVVAVLPTGAGKTVVLSEIVKKHNSTTAVMAHRKELVEQISMALARQGVFHNILAPKDVVKGICKTQLTEVGISYYNPSSRTFVASVDTLLARHKKNPTLHDNVTLWVMDEAHHILKSNKWGKCVELFPNARGLGVTATPCRADKKGLGEHADGVFHDIVVGPNMRELINRGYLCEYDVITLPKAMQNHDYEINASGDYSPKQRREMAKKSRIVGDVVAEYKKYANGLRGVTFATDLITASEIAAKFNAAGVPAMVVDGTTDTRVRSEAIARFKRGELLQLVNVDLFGEGVDIPAIEVVSFARPTKSYSLYVQQFGRALRLMKGKSKAIIIDHVGNICEHRLPDNGRMWSLDRPPKFGGGGGGRKVDELPLYYCTGCFKPYERFETQCPYCQLERVPEGRARPDEVDGDLELLDASALDQLRKEAGRIMGQFHAPNNLSPAIARIAERKHDDRKDAQRNLQELINLWSGYQAVNGKTHRQIQKKFYLHHNVDMATACTLGKPDALKLMHMVSMNIAYEYDEYRRRHESN